MKNIIVIGAGASGMMAAVEAAKEGAFVTVLEQNNKPLKKLLLTGNGRCNLTNLHWDDSVLRGQDVEKAYRIVKSFDHNAAVDFFEDIGIRMKDRNGWVYPVNDSAASVAKFLIYEAERLKVKIKTNQEVVSIDKENDGSFTVKTSDWKYAADAVIVSTGSIAGVSDKGALISIKTAEKFDIGAEEFAPALTSLKSGRAGIGKWAGARVDGEIALYSGGALTAKKRGQLQLTEYGISGIPVFELSRYAVVLLRSGKEAHLIIDFLPYLSGEEILRHIAAMRKKYPEKSLRTILYGLLNEKLADVIEVSARLDQDAAEQIKRFKLPLSGYTGADKAQVCMGGVDLGQLDENLESKNCSGLYFTGEAVDIDGTCGGYNLQWAWSSGYAAGHGCAAKK